MIPPRYLALALTLAACDATPASDRVSVERAHPAVAATSSDVSSPLDTASEPADALADSDDLTDAADADAPDADTLDTADTADITVADTSLADATPVDSESPDAIAPPPLGTFDDPYLVDRWPYVVDDTTDGAPSDRIDTYACAPATGERGPERVYQLTLDADGEFVAELDEADGVDVDLHLFNELPASSASEATCLARANTRLARDLTAGTYWLVVDSFSNAAGEHGGDYRLALELTVLDRWQTVAVAPGVTWRRKVYADYAGGRQSINALEIDLTDPHVEVKPYVGTSCVRPSRVGEAQGAIAAINGGFFDTGPGTCPSLDLVKIDGQVQSLNHLTGQAQRALGITSDDVPLMDWVDAQSDWPAAEQALAGYPSLVTDGVIALEPDKDSSFFTSRHPRTALGLRADGTLLLVTVDGRGETGSGMTLTALAQHMLNLGAEQAINLDGGGSTAMWVRDQSVNGVVNSPSDDASDDHAGERAVSDLLLVLPR